MAITAAMVKELREMTGAGMMDCKKAVLLRLSLNVDFCLIRRRQHFCLMINIRKKCHQR